MAPCKRQIKAKRNLTCSSSDSWIDFAKSGCANSWAEVQAADFHFVCRVYDSEMSAGAGK